MRKIISLFTASLLLASCVPAPQTDLDAPLSPPLAQSAGLESSPAAPTPIQLPVETSTSRPSPAHTGTGALAERMVGRGILEIGMADAPLTLTVFTNYACRYCQEFSSDMLPRLREEFMNDGTLRVQIVSTPLKKYPNSVPEAAALLCASALEKGQQMHSALTAAKTRDRKSLIALATKLPLVPKEFTKCLDAQETKNLLAEQQAFITEQDVTLIPTFILNGEKKTGLPSYADLRGWIRERVTQ